MVEVAFLLAGVWIVVSLVAAFAWVRFFGGLRRSVRGVSEDADQLGDPSRPASSMLPLAPAGWSQRAIRSVTQRLSLGH